MNKTVSPEELLTVGESIYFKNKESLEKSHLGEFAVIDIVTEDITINRDKLTAIQEAQKKYPDRLFYIVQVGSLSKKSTQEINEMRKYAWTF